MSTFTTRPVSHEHSLLRRALDTLILYILIPLIFWCMGYILTWHAQAAMGINGHALIFPRHPLPEKKITLQFPKSSVDLNKLAYAVGVAETGKNGKPCQDGTALKRLNCHGIMAWTKEGKRYPRYFKTQEDSFEAFKRIWGNPDGPYKGQYPDLRLSIIWTGNDNPVNWKNTVDQTYSSL